MLWVLKSCLILCREQETLCAVQVIGLKLGGKCGCGPMVGPCSSLVSLCGLKEKTFLLCKVWRPGGHAQPLTDAGDKVGGKACAFKEIKLP